MTIFADSRQNRLPYQRLLSDREKKIRLIIPSAHPYNAIYVTFPEPLVNIGPAPAHSDYWSPKLNKVTVADRNKEIVDLKTSHF